VSRVACPETRERRTDSSVLSPCSVSSSRYSMAGGDGWASFIWPFTAVEISTRIRVISGSSAVLSISPGGGESSVRKSSS
jgi:hypothetical protein